MIDNIVGPDQVHHPGSSYRVRLVASLTGEAAGSDPSNFRTIHGVAQENLRSALLAVDLTPNDDIPSPANTYYSIATQAVGRGAVTRTFRAPANPGSTVTTGSHTLPVATLNVVSTAVLAASGLAYVGGQVLTYTGKTGTTLTGVTGGDAGTVIAAGAAVEQAFWIPDYLLLDLPDSFPTVLDGGTPSSVYTDDQEIDGGTP